MTFEELQKMFPGAVELDTTYFGWNVSRRVNTWGRHENGGGWIEATTTVMPTAYVGPDAIVCGRARVLDQARVCDRAKVCGGEVRGASIIGGDAEIGTRNANPWPSPDVIGCGSSPGDRCRVRVEGRSKVSDHARVQDSARILDATVCGRAIVRDKAQVYGGPTIGGDVVIRDQAQVYYTNRGFDGHLVIGGDARVYDRQDDVEMRSPCDVPLDGPSEE